MVAGRHLMAPLQGTIDPRKYGADPTGRRDSSSAFAAALADLLSLGVRSRSTLSSNITDLAGAVLALGGGEYLLSEPLVIPMFYGNFRIEGGTLRADPSSFPRDKYILQIGDASCAPDYALSCNEFISISSVLLDASHAAAGGLLVTRSMGVSAGPALFVERFLDVGINIQEGHETLVHEAWLVGTYWNNEPPSPLAGSPRLRPCNASDGAQQWMAVQGGQNSPASQALPGRRLPLPGSLVNTESLQCVDVFQCTTPSSGKQLTMYTCNDVLPGNSCNSTNQLWIWVTDDEQTATLIKTAMASPDDLCVRAESESGGMLVMRPCNASDVAQQWTFVDGTLQNAAYPGQCMAAPQPGGQPGSSRSSSPARSPVAGADPPSLSNHSIAIQINGNDHYVIDTIIWQYTHLGVQINGAANLLMGVHAWGSGTPSLDYLTGIDVRGGQNRLIGCYLDFNYLDLHNPAAVVVEGGFFLGTGARLYGNVTGLFMTSNLGMQLEVLPGPHAQPPMDCRIEDNAGSPATKAIMSVHREDATEFVFDFAEALVFHEIASVQYTVVADMPPESVPANVARPPEGMKVVVEFASPVAATVHMEVAQCL